MSSPLDRFIAPAVVADPDLVFRARVVAALSVVLLGVGLPASTVAFLAYDLADPRPWIAAAPSAFNLVVLWLLRTREDHRPAALLQVGLIWAGHLAYCFLDGGLGSPAAPWALGMPVLGALTLGPTAGWIATGVAAVEVFALLTAAELGLEFGTPPPADWATIIHASSLLLLLGVIGVAAALFETARTEAMDEAQDALEQLQSAHDDLFAAHELTLDAARARQDFLARVSHELRTPIQGLLGTSRLLMEHGHGEVAGELASNARDSARGLLALVDDLLDVGRLEAGQLRLREVAFDPREPLEEAAGLAAEPARAKGLTLLCYVGPEVPTRCFGDPDRIRQVVLNLLSNAVRYSDQGDVVLRASLTDPDGDPRLRVEVSDSGVGIDLKKVPRTTLLRPFEQVEPFSTRSAGGAGLGLSIASQIIALMPGRLDLESEPGVGSTFWFELPLVEPAGPPPVDEALEGLRALVVGRHPRARSILATLLRDWSITTRALPADERTAEQLRAGEHEADVVILVASPDDEEPWLLPDLRALETVMNTPRVVTGPPGLLAEARGGFAPVLEPVRQDRLREVLRRVTRQSANRPASLESLRPSGEERLAAIPRGHGTLLVVEDDPVNALIGKSFLQRLGYTVVVATDGLDGLAQAEAQAFDGILMDCQLPRMTGYEVSERVRAGGGPNAQTPILAVTAHAREGEREKCLDAGMNGCLVKPYEPEELGARLHALLQEQGP